MQAPVITVEDLGKDYVISHLSDGAAYRTLRDSLGQWVKREKSQRTNPKSEIFSALNGVSFEVQQGEVLGIIGRNGAGKSTLLKILSRITEPTRGRVRLRGRVASLLEVGTGFHPELTGRENIFLNGAILGMTRAEIRRKFDEIVDFSGVEKFLDTPVKRYSSGMYVRLAFAVAAHLEPEILIIDEVLAVGDQAFQQKCLGKMRDVSASEGRTVLFVSHQLAAVRQLCQKVLLLNAGRVEAEGPSSQILELYQKGLTGEGGVQLLKPDAHLAESAHVTEAAMEDLEGRKTTHFCVGQPWRIRIHVRIAQTQKNFVIGIGLVGADGVPIQSCWQPPQDLQPGDYEALFNQDRVTLEAGTYTVLVGISADGHSIQQVPLDRLEISGIHPHAGFLPATSGVGAVLNSMKLGFRRIHAPT